MVFNGGDGEWVMLSKCADRWSYTLHCDQVDALCASGKSCGPACLGRGYHKVWRLLDSEEIAARKAPPATPEPEEDASFFWEKKMHVDGL